MQSQARILSDAVVEAVWLPAVCEEDHADGLAKVVQLQTGAADASHDRGIGDGVAGDVELAGAEDQVGVCGGAETRSIR